MKTSTLLAVSALTLWVLGSTDAHAEWKPTYAPATSEANGEKISWPSIVCTPQKCDTLTAFGYLYRKPGQRAIVLHSHGVAGLNGDKRIFDRVDQLQEEGIASLVIDHWASRGIGQGGVIENVNASPDRGASELNMALDIHTAVDMLRATYGFEKFGGIGASYGGGGEVAAQQAWVKKIAEDTVRTFYKRPAFVVRPLDAQVALYTFCGFRHKDRDAYLGTPILMISGEKDDTAPSKYCEAYVAWMNERGGNGQYVEIKGVGHGWDDRAAAHWLPGYKHNVKCNVLAENNRVTELNSGEVSEGPYAQVQRSVWVKCGTARGFTAGNSGNPWEAVPIWMAFLKQKLAVN